MGDEQIKAPVAKSAEDKGEDDRSQQGSGSPGYTARIALDRTSIGTENGSVDLGPGMAVTAEIKTGQRRVLDYVLSPLVRYRQEGMRER